MQLLGLLLPIPKACDGIVGSGSCLDRVSYNAIVKMSEVKVTEAFIIVVRKHQDKTIFVKPKSNLYIFVFLWFNTCLVSDPIARYILYKFNRLQNLFFFRLFREVYYFCHNPSALLIVKIALTFAFC